MNAFASLTSSISCFKGYLHVLVCRYDRVILRESITCYLLWLSRVQRNISGHCRPPVSRARHVQKCLHKKKARFFEDYN